MCEAAPIANNAQIYTFYSLSLITSALTALYFTPASYHLVFCPNTTYSRLLYAPLFTLAVVDVCVILNGGLIISVSARGSILKHVSFRQRHIPHLICLHVVLAMLELLALLVSIIGLYHPTAVSTLEECEHLGARLTFARATVLFQVVCHVFFWCTRCVFAALVCCTPSYREVAFHDEVVDDDIRGSQLLPTSDQVNVRLDAWSRVKLRRTGSWQHRLCALICCLHFKGAGVVAEYLYSEFGDVDYVLSDVFAGFSLLKERQLKMKKVGGEGALTSKFRKVYLDQQFRVRC